MSATAAGARSDEEGSAAQVGAASFSDLVRAHHRREQARLTGDAGAMDAAESEFRDQLETFQRHEGKLDAVYWSTRNASAVGGRREVRLRWR